MLATDWNVTRRALLARVNRKLAHSYEAVREYRRNQGRGAVVALIARTIA